MSVKQNKREQRIRRHARVRARIAGAHERLRVAVFRSNNSIYAQIIDDTAHKTLVSISERDLPAKDKKGSKTERAAKVGVLLAKVAAEKKITDVRFDRGGYKYHGRVKAFAEGAREGGITF